MRKTSGKGRLFESVVDTIGDTPSIRINHLAPAGITIYVKAEFFNPAASVKDRLAVSIIEEAERSGAYLHSNEERAHMLKLIKFINDRGGRAEIPALKKPVSNYKSVVQMFQSLLEHEVVVTESINRMVTICLEEKDYTTQNFLQWYVSEQIEEEKLAKMILDKLKLIGNDKSGLYLFDRDVASMAPVSGPGEN